jgi:FdhE protein
MTTDQREKALDRYREERPETSGVLDVFERIWELQERYAAHAAGWTPPARDTLDEALATGQPVFAVNAPPVDDERYAEAVEELAVILAESAEELGISAEDLGGADWRGALAEEDPSQAILDLDSFVERVHGRMGEDAPGAEHVRFVLMTALTPFLLGGSERTLEALEDIDWRAWSSGLCPVCGTPAGYGRILDMGEGAGGVRTLHCDVCRASWTYDRVRCVRCGSRDHAKLHYLFDVVDPAKRVHD